MSVIICLDPGHVRNYNHGAYDLYYEGTKMYDLAVMLKQEIDKYPGMEAIITRKNVDDNPELHIRGRIAKNAGARCFISLHTNAAVNPNINQVTIFRSIKMPGTEALAWKLENAIADLIGKDVPTTKYPRIATRLISSGPKAGQDYYGVLRGSTDGSIKESMIIEHVYHTNYKQAEWMYNNNNLRQLAIVEAKVLADYYADLRAQEINKPTNNTNNNNTTTVGKAYIVKSGDSWWSIAANQMGSGAKMYELAEYNNCTIKSVLAVGSTIKIPTIASNNDKSNNNSSNTNTTKPATGYKFYTVKIGDSWWGIAAREMGNGAKYKELAEYNGLKTTSIIKPGQTIKIPVA